MSYRFVAQKIVTVADEWCRNVLFDVQDYVRDYFTFDIRLIGSGEKRLVTQNGNGPFDLDYNLLLQKDKKDLIGNPQQIKNIFISAFKFVLKQRGINNYSTKDSSSVITVNKLDINNCVKFSFDVAIIVECDDEFFYRLTNDKNGNINRYIWNRIPNSKNYFFKFKKIKEYGYWADFKERYLTLKNMHLSRNDGIKSFSIFLETLNEFAV